jgi:hypothetical protein
VAPDDPGALRESLTFVLGDSREREHLGVAALAAARGPYSWAEAARRTLEVYSGLIDAPE